MQLENHRVKMIYVNSTTVKQSFTLLQLTPQKGQVLFCESLGWLLQQRLNHVKLQT